VKLARLAALGPLLAAACFADLSGFSDGSDASVATDGGADATTPPPPPGTPPPPPPGTDGSAEACAAAVTIDAPMATDLGGFTPVVFDLDGYPHVESFGGDISAVLLPVPDSGLLPVDAGPDADGGFAVGPLEIFQAHSGVWWPTRVPTEAFDVDVDVKVQCTVSGSCADGFVLAWLDLASVAALESTNNAGHTAGIPDHVAGAFVDLDDYQNTSKDNEPPDPPPPSVQINALDATKAAGTYAWTKASAEKNFLGAWHTFSVSMRSGVVSVKMDGAAVVTGSVPPLATALIGFSTGTGGETDSIAIRNVHGRFYSCTP
jgi:hypothetical protein